MAHVLSSLGARGRSWGNPCPLKRLCYARPHTLRTLSFEAGLLLAFSVRHGQLLPELQEIIPKPLVLNISVI